MLKATAIFLISIHLANIVGSYGILRQIERLHIDEISAQLAQGEFAGSDAITLRIPLALPYPVVPSNYEQVEGNYEYGGQVYRLVRQKLYNDTLLVVCVKDTRSSRLKEAFRDLAGSYGEHKQPGASHHNGFSFIVRDFEQGHGITLSDVRSVITLISYTRKNFPLAPGVSVSVDQPPKV